MIAPSPQEKAALQEAIETLTQIRMDAMEKRKAESTGRFLWPPNNWSYFAMPRHETILDAIRQRKAPGT